MIVDSPPSAAYMSQLTGSALVEIMACRQATIYTNAELLSVRPLGQKTQNTKLAIHEMHLATSSAKRQAFVGGS